LPGILPVIPPARRAHLIARPPVLPENQRLMAELDVSQLMTVAQAMTAIDAVPVAPRVTRVSLTDAAGRRLAREVLADRDFPPFAKSTMDGFAVRSADVVRTPAELQVVGRIAAGRALEAALEPGQAAAIMTGAPLPAGADGVVPVEETEERDGSVRVLKADGIARYVAQRGSDCAKGKLVLPKGMLFGPAQIAVAASVGAAEVEVFELPRVAVLGTGDELVPFDAEPGPAQIRNCNNPMLVSLLKRLGCAVHDMGIAPDNPDFIRARIIEALTGDYDALFVTGGMSMGEHDYVPKILQELGVELKVTKLRIKPGKPFVFGAKNGAGTEPSRPRYVFGLPGNPVSGFVCTVRLASRLIDRLGGGPVNERWLTGRLLVGLPANGPREFYIPTVRTVQPARISAQAVLPTIRPLEWKGSADVFTLASANSLLVRAANEPPLPDGTLVRVLDI
jgi:molybdopterin molybdotransferase